MKSLESILKNPSIFPNFENLEANNSFGDIDQHSTFAACMKVLQNSHHHRESSDLAVIVDALKQFKYLTTASDHPHKSDRAFIELAKLVRYQYFNSQKTLFHKGDNNDRIYLILQGTVAIFQEVVDEVFQVKVAALEEKKEERSSTLINPVKMTAPNHPLLHRSMTSTLIDPTPKILFQPKLNRKLCRQQTSIGDLNSPVANLTSLQVIPTVHDLKKTVNESKPGTIPLERSGPTGIDLLMQQENAESPTWASKETRKKLLMYKLLLKTEKEKPGTYIKDGRFLFELKKKLEEGSHFGDSAASRNSHIKDTTAIGTEGLHVLSFTVEDYVRIFNHHPDNTHQNLRFFEPFFPDASYPKLVRLMSLFEECEYNQKHLIFEEGAPVVGMFLIKEGDIQLIKDVHHFKSLERDERSYTSGLRKKFCVANLGKGEILGEDDVFFGEKVRQYSAVVTSTKAVLLKLKTDVYNKINDTYKELFTQIHKTANVKRNFHQRQIDSINKQAAQIAHEIEESKFKPKPKAQQVSQSQKKSDIKPIKEPSKVGYGHEEKSSPLRRNRLERSPSKSANDSPQESPKKNPQHFPQRDLGIHSYDASPVNKERRLTFNREGNDSPTKSVKALSTLADDKKEFDFGALPKEIGMVAKLEKSQSALKFGEAKSSTKRKSERVIPFDGPLADQYSSLYKRALRTLRKRKVNPGPPEKSRVPQQNPNQEQYLQLDEIKKTVLSNIHRTAGARAFSPVDGYVSLEGSPVSKQKTKSYLIWNSVVSKGKQDKAIECKPPKQTSVSTEKLKTKTDHSQSKLRHITGVDIYPPKLSGNSDHFTPLGRIHSPKFALNLLNQTPNTSTNTQTMTNLSQSPIRRYREMEEESEETFSGDDSRIPSHIKLGKMLSKNDGEILDPALRVGFKPGKPKSIKIKYKYHANSGEKGEIVYV